jgi:sugar lactone lactonase YvrE
MSIDRYGSIYVSDRDNHKVIRFASNSSVPIIIAGINGEAGNQPNQLYWPYGIYVDDNLTLYIADSGNNRIQMWKYGASSGSTVAGGSSSGTNLAQLSTPVTIIVDMNKYMYIADYSNSRIVRWAPNATSGVCIAACTGTSGTKDNQLHSPWSLTFDNKGSLYVSDNANNRVQKFQILNDGSNNITVTSF